MLCGSQGRQAHTVGSGTRQGHGYQLASFFSFFLPPGLSPFLSPPVSARVSPSFLLALSLSLSLGCLSVHVPFPLRGEQPSWGMCNVIECTENNNKLYLSADSSHLLLLLRSFHDFTCDLIAMQVYCHLLRTDSPSSLPLVSYVTFVRVRNLVILAHFVVGQEKPFREFGNIGNSPEEGGWLHPLVSIPVYR